MWEQSKAAKRRFHDGLFHSRFFVGKGIDIGGGPDPLGQYAGVFARMESARTWDAEDGDAQLMQGVPDDSFDFVHSSHCLEHLKDPRAALQQWIRIVKPGGFIVILVPDEDLYEHGRWPSAFNSDHKWTFTIHKWKSWSPRSINIIDLIMELSHLVEVERVLVLRDFFREHFPDAWPSDRSRSAASEIEDREEKPPRAKPKQSSAKTTHPQHSCLCRDFHRAMLHLLRRPPRIAAW